MSNVWPTLPGLDLQVEVERAHRLGQLLEVHNASWERGLAGLDALSAILRSTPELIAGPFQPIFEVLLQGLRAWLDGLELGREVEFNVDQVVAMLAAASPEKPPALMN